MVMQVNFGNFSQINGKTVLSGMISGLNTKDIINGLGEVKKLEIQKVQDEVTLNNNIIQSYITLTQNLTSLNNAANALKYIPGFDQSGNSFAGRTVFATTSNGQPASTYMSITALNGADINSHTISIGNTAVAKSQTSATFSSISTDVTQAPGGTTAGLFVTGTYQINGTPITVNAGNTLLDIQDEINSVSYLTNVTADIIQVSSTDYRLVIESTLTGVANAYTITDASGVLAHISFPTNVPALNANFTFDNIPMSRPLNTITDVIDALSFTLYQGTGGATVNIDIGNDPTVPTAAINNFIDAYNQFITFSAIQQARDSNGKLLPTSYLGNDNLLKTITASVVNEVTNMVKGLASSNYNSLYSLGISMYDKLETSTTPEINNLLQLDAPTLASVLSTNFEDVRRVFEFDFHANSNSVRYYGSSNNVSIYNFSLAINTGNPPGTQVTLTYGMPAVMINPTYSGNATIGTITGASGSVIDGLKIGYVGTGIDNINISYSQGIADRLFNIIDPYIEDIPYAASGGLIEMEINALIDENYDYQDDINKKTFKMQEYMEGLIAKYTKVEEAISQVNSILAFIDAQNKAMEHRG